MLMGGIWEAEINEASYTKNINVETKLSRQRINSFSVAWSNDKRQVFIRTTRPNE